MSWPVVKLLNCCEISTGKFDANHGVTEGSFPFYTCAEKPIAANTYSFDGDSIILPGNGANVGLVLFYSGKFEAYQRTYVLNGFKNDVYSRYVFHHLSKYWKLRNERSQFGSATNYIRMQNFEDYEIPLPPLEEQKRIAAILDKADSIRRKRQQAIKLADDFLRSVFLEMFGDPVTNPKGWEIGPLKEGITSIKSGWSAKGESQPCKSGQLGVLKISAVTSGIFKSSENKYVPDEEIDNGKKLIFPRRGDLLFSRANTRELVAATCIVPDDVDNVFLPDKLWLINTNKEKLLPEFLHCMIWYPKFKDTLTSQATGTSGSMLNISMGKFELTASIFPSIDKQKAFGDIYWKVQHTLQLGSSSYHLNNDVFSSLSQKAFSGK